MNEYFCSKEVNISRLFYANSFQDLYLYKVAIPVKCSGSISEYYDPDYM